MRAPVSIRQYGRYTVIGAVVGFITNGLREIAGRLLPADNPQFYLVSVGLAYAFGIVLNYLLQRALTFRHASPDGRQLAFFVIVALIGAAATALLAVVFRYGLPLDLWLGRWSPALAFAAAALASSLLTYWLNAQFVFQARNTSRESMARRLSGRAIGRTQILRKYTLSDYDFSALRATGYYLRVRSNRCSP